MEAMRNFVRLKIGWPYRTGTLARSVFFRVLRAICTEKRSCASRYKQVFLCPHAAGVVLGGFRLGLLAFAHIDVRLLHFSEHFLASFF